MTEGIVIPLNLAEITGTLIGLSIWAFFVGQWAKHGMPDWRWTNWVVLGVVCVTSVLGVLILNAWAPTAEQIMWSVLLAVMATSFETWGYEAIANGLGKVLGIGSRSNVALEQKARVVVREAEAREVFGAQ
jgi:hypothetical protein